MKPKYRSSLRRIWIYCLSLFLTICNVGIAQPSIQYTTSNLNMRVGPSTDSKVILVIPKGTPVTIDKECDCSWIPVSYNGITGYISTKYLSKNKPSFNSSPNYYTNSEGHRVQSPTYYLHAPQGATALCRDGTYSFSRNRRGTCFHHGGVAKWLN